MLRKLLPALMLFSAFWSVRPASGQQRPHPEHTFGYRCAFDSVQQAEFQRNPAAAREYRDFLRLANDPATVARLLALPDVTVPVVVHIIHTGGTSNISDAQVYDAIRIMNEDFNKQNRDTSDVIPFFQPRYARVGFQFKLAQKDPSGNCSTGITRTYSTLTNSASDNVKSLIRWDPNRYVNIYVVSGIASGAGGYAYLPCSSTSIDGIVILSTQFGSIGRSGGSNFAARSLTHEMGHNFGLPHTWGGTNTPGVAGNCSDDDGIADTPNTVGVGSPVGGSGCPLTNAYCTDANGQPILANVQNYMDYSSCAKMFTTGQKNVMRAALLLTCRAAMVSPANLLATGTNDGYVPVPCSPVVAFSASQSTVCQGSSVTFASYSYNATFDASTQFQWSFPGGTPSTATGQAVTVTYTTPGIYNATLTVTHNGLTGSSTQQQVVRVIGPGSTIPAPYRESFEDSTWLKHPAVAGATWVNESSTTSSTDKWRWIVGINSVDGIGALRLQNSSLPTGTNTYLYTPFFDLSNAAGGPYTLSFNQAYARRQLTSSPATYSTDIMRVQLSNDCGQSWYNALTLSSVNMATNASGQPISSSNFTPTPAEWAKRTITLPAAYANSQRLQVRFQVTSNGGAYLWLDDVRISGPNAARSADMSSHGISVYPNPVTRETAVHFTLDQPTPARVQVLDLLGRTVLSTETRTFGAGRQQVALPAGQLSAGVYVVQLTLGQQRYTTRVMVQ